MCIVHTSITCPFFLNHTNLHSADFLSIKPSIITLIVKFTILPIVTFLITYIVVEANSCAVYAHL